MMQVPRQMAEYTYIYTYFIVADLTDDTNS